MAKKTAEKTAGITMAGFQPKPRMFDGQTPSPAPSSPGARMDAKPFTGVGNVMAAFTREAEVTRELAQAKALLREFDGAKVVRSLNPMLIRRSRWANRIEAEFQTQEFHDLKKEIEGSGGNVQAIKVRPLAGPFDGQTPQFEIAFGHRRHQACLELGLPVNAVVEDMDDRTLFEAMERENRGRKNLSAWEQGRMYSDAIKNGLYPSIRQLADALGVNVSDASRSIQLMALPNEVVAAFSSPLDLQVRFAKPLSDALQRDPDGVLSRARELAKDRGALGAMDILRRLASLEGGAAIESMEITHAGKKVATLRAGTKGRAVIDFEAGMVPSTKYKALAKLVSDFISKHGNV